MVLGNYLASWRGREKVEDRLCENESRSVRHENITNNRLRRREFRNALGWLRSGRGGDPRYDGFVTGAEGGQKAWSAELAMRGQ